VRADIDEAGFVVVERVRSVAPAAKAWRYDAATYAHLCLTFVDATPDEQAKLRHLRELYAQHQTPLHEETLLDQLLGDLAIRRRVGAET